MKEEISADDGEDCEPQLPQPPQDEEQSNRPPLLSQDNDDEQVLQTGEHVLLQVPHEEEQVNVPHDEEHVLLYGDEQLAHNPHSPTILSLESCHRGGASSAAFPR